MTAPETVVAELDLVYVDNLKLPIHRRRKKKGFDYVLKDKAINDAKLLDRIEGLVIPPAWEDVRITHLVNGHLQAVGLDIKNRKQYRYHPTWLKIRNQTKFYRMAAFGKQLPRIRKQVEKDLRKKTLSKDKVVALVIKLMEETHIRIGSEQYAKRNKSYGLSTLRKKHVHLDKQKLKFEFVGKKGKKHSVTIRNKKLIRLVSQCEDIPGWELFQYYDDDGNKQQIESSMINEYLLAICDQFFTAKDFRTWAASVVFFDTLLEMDPTADAKEINRNILTGYDAAAAALGNTRTVCRKYYVHPLLVSSYESGALQKYFNLADAQEETNPYFTASETAILRLIKKYTPEINGSGKSS